MDRLHFQLPFFYQVLEVMFKGRLDKNLNAILVVECFE